MHSTIGVAIQRFVEREDVTPPFGQENLTVGILLNDPQANIVVSLNGENGSVTFDREALPPDSAVSMSANTAHDLISGQRNLGKVTSANEIVVVGDRQALAVLSPFPESVRPHYKAALGDERRSDLLVNWDKEPQLKDEK